MCAERQSKQLCGLLVRVAIPIAAAAAMKSQELLMVAATLTKKRPPSDSVMWMCPRTAFPSLAAWWMERVCSPRTTSVAGRVPSPVALFLIRHSSAHCDSPGTKQQVMPLPRPHPPAQPFQHPLPRSPQHALAAMVLSFSSRLCRVCDCLRHLQHQDLVSV